MAVGANETTKESHVKGDTMTNLENKPVKTAKVESYTSPRRAGRFDARSIVRAL